jgi:hypothetical protein
MPTRRRADPTGEEREKQAYALPRSLRRRLRVAAAVQDREISSLVEDAIGFYLDHVDQERARQGLPPLPRE